MATQPTYWSTGTTPLATDTRRNIVEKILGAVQNNLTAPDAANNPKQTDPLWILEKKLTRARAGL